MGILVSLSLERRAHEITELIFTASIYVGIVQTKYTWMCETPRTFHTRGAPKLCIETKIHVPSVSGVYDFIPRLLSFLWLMILFHMTINHAARVMYDTIELQTDIFLACLVGIIDQTKGVKQKANLMQNCIIPAYLCIMFITRISNVTPRETHPFQTQELTT